METGMRLLLFCVFEQYTSELILVQQAIDAVELEQVDGEEPLAHKLDVMMSLTIEFLHTVAKDSPKVVILFF